jgi:hypothetical protein
MKLIKSQNFPPPSASTTVSSNENNLNFGTDSNVSSSSSSSFTSSNFGNVTPTPKHQQQFYNSSNPSNRLPSSKMLINNIKANSFAQNQNVSHQQNQPFSSSNQITPLVHYYCNKCSKSLLEKKNNQSFIVTQHFNQPNVPLNQQVSINTKSYPINSSTAQSKVETETSINGCSNCAHLLPQCVICLRLMKINLAPSQMVNHSQNSNQNYHILPLSRSQPFLHHASAKIVSNSYPSSKTKSILLHRNVNSPNVHQNENHSPGVNANSALSNNINSNDEKRIKDATHEQNCVDNNSVFQNENIYFLANSKFGTWFSWCATCKHGGHIKHLIDWFKHHKKCPYVHCECICTNLDYQN